MKKHHEVMDVSFDGDTLLVNVGGQAHHFALADISRRLLAASTLERAKFEISPSGYGIHWPLLDEDLSIDGLLGISHSPTMTKGREADLHDLSIVAERRDESAVSLAEMKQRIKDHPQA